MFRLPVQECSDGLDLALVGVQLDIGTSNCNGTRYGRRQIRCESVLVRPYGMATGATPFDFFRSAETGGGVLNPHDLLDSIERIELHYDRVMEHGCVLV